MMSCSQGCASPPSTFSNGTVFSSPELFQSLFVLHQSVNFSPEPLGQPRPKFGTNYYWLQETHVCKIEWPHSLSIGDNQELLKSCWCFLERSFSQYKQFGQKKMKLVWKHPNWGGGVKFLHRKIKSYSLKIFFLKPDWSENL